MKDIYIIGAGPAGLTAAYELLSARNPAYRVIILEESGTVGGISQTVVYHGNRMDIGGHRFFSKDPRVTKWWANILPMQGAPAMDDLACKRDVKLLDGGSDPEKTDAVMLRRRRVSRIYYKKRFFDYPVRMNLNTIRNMGFATTMQAGISYLAACMDKLPENSLENFYINRFGRKLYSMFFESYTEKLWGRHPREISAEWGAQRVKGLSVRAVLKDMLSKFLPENLRSGKVETSLIEEFSYPKYGPGQLWETVAEKIREMGGEIRLNCKITGLRTENNRVSAVCWQTSDHDTVEAPADIVLSSMPLCDLIAGMNDVPDEVRRIAAGLPYRDFVTTGLLVDKLDLKNETNLQTVSDIVPDCWIYMQDGDVKLGRIQIFNNWSPYMVKDVRNTVWIGLEYFCREGDEDWSQSDEHWKELAVRELRKTGILSSDARVLDSHVEKVKKAYPAYFDTYAEIETLRSYLDTIDNLYCIGRNGQHRYNNMDHSMVTAFEAVGNILNGRRDRSNIWNVNTEREYHETEGERNRA